MSFYYHPTLINYRRLLRYRLAVTSQPLRHGGSGGIRLRGSDVIHIYYYKYALFTLPGAVAGAILAVRLDDIVFQRILAVIMVLIVLTLFLPKTAERKSAIIGKKPWVVYLALLGAGFYGGFIQVGVGFILMAIMFHLAGLTLVKVNVHKVFIILLYTIPALLIFILTDNVHWKYGLILAAGNGIGGWISARISVKKGESYIRIILAIAIIIMAYKLIQI